jgi:nucleotide-binding universal stress UspA family protein
MKEIRTVVAKILVATDFSDKAQKALDIACTLARTTRADITLLHVIELPYSTEIRKEKLRQDLEKSAKPALKEEIKRAKSKLARLKVKVESQLIVGNAVHAIVHEAGRGNYDLLCIGNRITGGLRRLVFDNITSGVIDLSPIPVLATTATRSEINLQTMLMGTEFKQGDMQILGRICKLAMELKSQVHVVHVSKKLNFDDQLRLAGFEYLSRASIEYKALHFHKLIGGEVEKGIEKAIDDINAGLIILSREKRSFLDALLGSDVIDELVYKLEIPILVMPIQPVVG